MKKSNVFNVIKEVVYVGLLFLFVLFILVLHLGLILG